MILNVNANLVCPQSPLHSSKCVTLHIEKRNPKYDLNSYSRLREHELNLVIAIFNTKILQGFLSNTILRFWNNLSKHLVAASSVNSFKNGLGS